MVKKSYGGNFAIYNNGNYWLVWFSLLVYEAGSIELWFSDLVHSWEPATNLFVYILHKHPYQKVSRTRRPQQYHKDPLNTRPFPGLPTAKRNNKGVIYDHRCWQRIFLKWAEEECSFFVFSPRYPVELRRR